MTKAMNHQIEKMEISGVKVSITTYQIGEKFFCHVANDDPGATIARAEGSNQVEVKEVAMAKATKRLQ